MSITNTLAPRTLKASDRCDRCGAQAFYHAILSNGSSLMFCAHHANKKNSSGVSNLAALRKVGATIIDESAYIN